ncbi:MAG: acyloxyacyl hydrolase [Verrucomicrobiota bacterium]
MKKSLWIGYVLALLTFSAWTQTNDAKNESLDAQNRYAEDRITMQLVSGPFLSDTGIGPNVNEYNYVQNNLRVGWILNTPGAEDNPLRGSWEAIGELSGSVVVSSYGDLMVGPTALLRYNFVQPNWVVIPYIQGGAGVVYNDGYEVKSQRALGQAFEFTPQVSVGMRCLVDENWSVDFEGMYHHISNACMADRNAGVNAFGGMIGCTYFFDNLWK